MLQYKLKIPTSEFLFSRKYRLHKKIQDTPHDEPYPGVSILKPLMGVDPHLVSNLETFFTMRYPTVSFINILFSLLVVGN